MGFNPSSGRLPDHPRGNESSRLDQSGTPWPGPADISRVPSPGTCDKDYRFPASPAWADYPSDSTEVANDDGAGVLDNE